MKRLLCSLLLAYLMVMIAGGVAVASDISNAIWRGDIVVSNNGTATSLVSTNITSLNSTSLRENGFVASDLSDTAILINGIDTAFMPGYENNPWIVYVPTIGNLQHLNYDLYTNDVTGGKIRYFPDDSGMTTSDAASLELGDNFTYKIGGFINTGNITLKEDAFAIWCSSDNISAGIYAGETNPTSASGWSNNEDGYDDNTGTNADSGNIDAHSYSDYYVVSHSGIYIDSIRYHAQDDNNYITNINIDAYYAGVWNTVFEGAWVESAYTTIYLTTPQYITQARLRVYNDSGSLEQAHFNEVDFNAYTPVASSEIEIGEHDIEIIATGSDPIWTSPSGFEDPDSYWDHEEYAYDDNATSAAQTKTNTIPTESWSSYLILDVDDAYYDRFRFDAQRGAGTIQTIDLDAYYGDAWNDVYEGDFTNHTWVEKTIAEAEYITKARVRFYNQSPDWGLAGKVYEFDFGVANRMRLYIDDELQGSTNFEISVPDTSNDWITGAGGSMLYIEYQEITIGGVQKQYVDWEYTNGDFTDSSGNGNDATPNFRINSSSANVSANLASFKPVNEAEIDDFKLSETYSILTANATFPDEMFSELDTSNIPGGEAIDEVLIEGGVPQAAWWYPFIFLGICVIGFIVYGATTLTRVSNGRLAEGQIDGSLLIMFVVMEVALATISLVGPIPFWPAILFPIAGFAIIMSRKHFSWG